MQGSRLGCPSEASRRGGFEVVLANRIWEVAAFPRLATSARRGTLHFPAILVRLGLAFFQLSGFILHAARQLLLVGVELLTDGLIGEPNYLRG